MICLLGNNLIRIKTTMSIYYKNPGEPILPIAYCSLYLLSLICITYYFANGACKGTESLTSSRKNSN